MSHRLLMGTLAALILAASAVPVAAQDATAEVRTWAGQTWSLAQPSLDVYYTILPTSKEAGGGVEPPAGAAGAAGTADTSSLRISGSLQAVGGMFQTGPEPMQGRTVADSMSFSRGGIETRVPLASIVSLTFYRQPVAGSTFPPYWTHTHFRYAATAVLNDGSRVEGDYVNLGATTLRGMTPQGRVEIRWEDIETVRFQR
jgi:hypothetical protein